MIKKAVIMAAGKGVRMLPLTNLVPKPMIPINGRPFLHYVLSNLHEAGYDDIAIIVGHKSEKINSYLKKEGMHATLIHQRQRLGTGHALKQAESFAGRSSFIALGGDNLWSASDLRRIAAEDNLNYVAAIKVDSPEAYGAIVEKNGYLVRIVEKPKKFVSNIINTALYKFTHEIFEALSKIPKSERGEYELTDALTMLAREKKVKVIRCRDYWLDLGKLIDIPRIESFLSQLESRNKSSSGI